MTAKQAKVLVLCLVSRQIADDLYVKGQQYRIAAERAAKYGDYFTVLTVTEGDEYDAMKVKQLQEIVEGLGIEGVDSNTRRPGLLEAIRAHNATVAAATGKSDGQGSNSGSGSEGEGSEGKGSGSGSSESGKSGGSDPNE